MSHLPTRSAWRLDAAARWHQFVGWLGANIQAALGFVADHDVSSGDEDEVSLWMSLAMAEAAGAAANVGWLALDHWLLVSRLAREKGARAAVERPDRASTIEAQGLRDGRQRLP